MEANQWDSLAIPPPLGLVIDVQNKGEGVANLENIPKIFRLRRAKIAPNPHF